VAAIQLAVDLTMNIRLLLCCLLLTISLFAQAPTVATLRADFKKAADDESAATSLLEKLQRVVPQTPLIIGYTAATETILAKHAFMPTSKYSWCKKGINRFKVAIAGDPDNLEIRFLRIAVEANLPGFLNMSGDVPADKQKIMTLLPASTDKALNKDVAEFLIKQHLCTGAEESALKKYLH
jgi:hypothetical protein